MHTLSEFSRALTAAQKSSRVTATALAQKTGLSTLAVRKILSGESAPRLTNAMALASELGLELVLLPKDAAQSLAGNHQAERTVLTDIERRLQQMNAPRIPDSK